MTSRGGARWRRGGKVREDVEWIGGIAEMPGTVTGEGAPFRPETLLWISAEGLILGNHVGRPGTLLDEAADDLRKTIEAPMMGPAHAPTIVRVASSALADRIRTAFPDIDVVCAPTPELDELMAMLTGALAEGVEDDTRDYLLEHNRPEACAAFCEAAAALVRAAPWKVVPSDQDLFAVTIDALDVHDGALCVIGQLGQSRGAVLFPGLAEYDAFIAAVEGFDEEGTTHMPPHLDLNIERRGEIPDSLRREIEEHGWTVHDESSYPWPLAADTDRVGRTPTAKELAICEVVARALVKVLRAKKALHTAWEGGTPVVKTFTVPTHGGEVEVTLGTPYDAVVVPRRPDDDLLACLFDLAEEGPIEPASREPLEQELLERFADAPEGRTIEDIDPCLLLMDLGADYLDCTIATLQPSGLREVVFEIIPRKVSIDASEARAHIETMRAFYAYLGRAHDLPQAQACLRLLEEDAVSRLEAALSDPSMFGMAKTFLMAGAEAGYDMDTTEGLQAWLEASQGQPLPSLAGPIPPAESRRAGGAKKKTAKKKSTKKKARTKTQKKSQAKKKTTKKTSTQARKKKGPRGGAGRSPRRKGR